MHLLSRYLQNRQAVTYEEYFYCHYGIFYKLKVKISFGVKFMDLCLDESNLIVLDPVRFILSY
jgi:hypothetical protein